MPQIDLIAFNRRAVDRSIEIVRQVTSAPLDSPTPCSEWTLRELLEHMIVQHHGFANAADGSPSTVEDWQPRLLSDDPVAEYVAAAEHVVDAFGADAVLDQGFLLPEITTAQTFPGKQAVGFHFVDYVVHGWDVARALGVDHGYHADVLEAVLPYVYAVPGGDVRLRPGSMFSPEVDPGDQADPMSRIVAHLGRDPHWTASRE
jgi:uncharacterized protein (TIGR03086 family)